MSGITELTVTENSGVDLDGLRLLTRPDDIDRRTEEERRQWLRANGYDLSIDLDDEKVVWVHGVETNLTVIPNDRWDEPDLSWIGETLQRGTLSSPLVLWELPQDILPLTFAFRTENGTSGLFRITAYSRHDKKATIQIKLHE